MGWVVPSGRRASLVQLVHPPRHWRGLTSVAQLRSWDVDLFRRDAFNPEKPIKLPLKCDHLPPAYTTWFLKDAASNRAELQASLWPKFKDIMVPLEVTSKVQGSPDNTSPASSFYRTEAPLEILLASLSQKSSEVDKPSHSIYLAQCSLQSLPQELRDDIPTPEIVLKAGKGDVYESSLWLGRSPTYTPLHRDPNPNFFFQLAGTKVVRLLPPAAGNVVFDIIQDNLRRDERTSSSSASFRGEEMMVGAEANLLHATIWDPTSASEVFVQEFGQQAEIDAGEALFIPKGWWHSVKGVREGVNASVNWWFR